MGTIPVMILLATIIIPIMILIMIGTLWYARRARRRAELALIIAREATEVAASAELAIELAAKDSREKSAAWRNIMEQHIIDERDAFLRLGKILRELSDAAASNDMTLMRGLQEAQMEVAGLRLVHDVDDHEGRGRRA